MFWFELCGLGFGVQVSGSGFKVQGVLYAGLPNWVKLKAFFGFGIQGHRRGFGIRMPGFEAFPAIRRAFSILVGLGFRV